MFESIDGFSIPSYSAETDPKCSPSRSTAALLRDPQKCLNCFHGSVRAPMSQSDRQPVSRRTLLRINLTYDRKRSIVVPGPS